jgi:outer membrane protein OmpA-like peptidoglycan-associated protein
MKTALFLAFILFIQNLSGQEKDQAELKEYFYDAEFFFAQEAYSDALYDYTELYNNGFKNNANINYRMGICYLNIPGQKDKSISYLLEATRDISPKYKESTFKQVSAPSDAWLFLGNAYRVNNLLSNAIEAYNKFKEIAASKEETEYANQQIAACNTAIRFMDNPVKLKYSNIGDSINGTSSNFKAVISGDGKTMLYMNELPFYDAVYFSRFNNNSWSAPINITPQIQSDGDQYVTSVSYDGDMLFLTKEDAFNSDIYYSRYANGRWSKSVPVEGTDINTKYWESHAAVSKDGKVLYFTSNRKEGFGDMDIYRAQLQANGQWGQPVNLGNVINTSLNEDTPFITDNDSLLFFSSQGHETMGGYDIFKSQLNAAGQWSMPQNLMYPLNSTDDDLFYYPWHNARIGYISLIRPEGFGKEDIYAVQPEDDVPYAELFSELITTENVPATPQINEVIINESPTSPEVTAAQISTPVIQEVPPPVTEPPHEIELEPVYFAFDNFELSEKGRQQLDKVVQLMKDYPVVRIKLVGHADAKGPADYNLKLSEKRAATALQYIVNKGIETGKLEIRAMGEKNFVAVNSNADGTDNPEGRQLNRRVEYEITGVNETLLIIRQPAIPEGLKIKK